MSATINLENLLAIFNEYIRDKSFKSFFEFAESKGYLKTQKVTVTETVHNADGTATEKDVERSVVEMYYEEKFPAITNAKLNFDTKNLGQLKKVQEFIVFCQSNKESIVNEDALDETVQDICNTLLLNDVHLNFNKQDAQTIAEEFSLGDDDAKLKKRHGKFNFVMKKFVLPAAITVVLTTLAACGIGGIAAIAGSSILWSGSVGLGIAAVASLGVVAGILLTPIVILAKMRASRTRNSTHKKDLLKVKDTSLEKGYDVEAVWGNLNIFKKMKKFKAVEAKMQKRRNKKGRLKLSYFHFKANRNRLHDIVKFRELLVKDKDTSGLSTNQKKSYETMLSYIDDSFMHDIVKSDVSAKNQNEIKNYRYLDIIAKKSLTKSDRKNTQEVKKQAKQETQQVAQRSLTGNKSLVGAACLRLKEKKEESIDQRINLESYNTTLAYLKTERDSVKSFTGLSDYEIRIFIDFFTECLTREKFEPLSKLKKSINNPKAKYNRLISYNHDRASDHSHYSALDL